MNCRNGSIYCLVIETCEEKRHSDHVLRALEYSLNIGKVVWSMDTFDNSKKSLKFEYIKKNV